MISSLGTCKKMVRGSSTARKNDLVWNIFMVIANFMFRDWEQTERKERDTESSLLTATLQVRKSWESLWHQRLPSCWGLQNFTFLEKKQERQKKVFLASKLDWPFLWRARQPLHQTRASGGLSAARGSHHTVWLHKPMVSTAPHRNPANNSPSYHSALTSYTCSQRSQAPCWNWMGKICLKI